MTPQRIPFPVTCSSCRTRYEARPTGRARCPRCGSPTWLAAWVAPERRDVGVRYAREM